MKSSVMWLKKRRECRFFLGWISVPIYWSNRFLLARLHMDALSSKHNKKALRAAFESLPKEINSTYDEALSHIKEQSEDDRTLANNVLMWLTCATRPLRVKELQHALALAQDLESVEENHSWEVDEDAITELNILTSVCVGLVVVDESSNTLRLVRESLSFREGFSYHSLTPRLHDTRVLPEEK
jgi:hypothetical protein